jgi:hypothetical protein
MQAAGIGFLLSLQAFSAGHDHLGLFTGLGPSLGFRTGPFQAWPNKLH